MRVIKVETPKCREFICDACGSTIIPNDNSMITIYFTEYNNAIGQAVCQRCYDKYYNRYEVIHYNDVDEYTKETIDFILHNVVFLSIVADDDWWDVIARHFTEIQNLVMKYSDKVDYVLFHLSDYDLPKISSLSPKEWEALWILARNLLDKILLLKYLIDAGLMMYHHEKEEDDKEV